MSEQFDKKLINRINEVFEKFEDDSADKGWLELRKRLPEPRRRRYAGWWMSSAAAILLLIGGWYLSSRQGEDQRKQKLAIVPPAKKTSPKTDNESLLPAAALEESDGGGSHNTASIKKPSIKTHWQQHIAERVISSKATEEIAFEPLEFGESQSQQDLTIVAIASQKLNKKPDSVIEDPSNSSKPPVSTAVAKETTDIEVFPAEVGTKTQLADLIPERQENTKSKSKLQLAVFAGSYFTYAEGSEASINTGVGVSSEIKLGKKLRLSTGVSLGQNSLKFNAAIPEQATLNFARTTHMEENSLQSPYSGSSGISIQSYNARLLGFDIPFNLKYLLLQKKNTVYLTTGFSSNFFINESYTYDYNYGSNINNPQNQPYGQSSGHFQSFDFARIVNLSVGYEYPLNEKTKLSFEPFIKYPLSGLGSHDLRFGAAGMNLKFNFNR